MPDWTYQTVFKPLLFQLAPATASRLALGFMGRLGRFPGGRTVISLMGHMAPDTRLQTRLPDGRTLASPVGLGVGLDTDGCATAALTQFGFGFLEVGPVGMDAAAPPLERDDAAETLVYADVPQLTVDQAVRRLRGSVTPNSLPVFVRLAPSAREDAAELADALADHAQGLTVPADWPLETLQALRLRTERLWLVAPANTDPEEVRRLAAGLRTVADGWVVGEPRGRSWRIGHSDFDSALATTAALRAAAGPDAVIVQAVGVHCPDDAMASFHAGADLVQASSGLMFSGPGLPKRINEATLYRRLHAQQDADGAASGSLPAGRRVTQMAWFWTLLMGAAMFFGGLLAMAIASTRVVLPYDEAMTGLTRSELDAINPRLLAFMTHDRVTLAGTMLAVGLIYSLFAWFGVRRGVHWAWVAVITSAMAGFLSFFSFLGFGYFDPFHAFVTALLFQLLLLAMHSDLPPRTEPQPPELTNSARWRRSQWGQLSFVVHGAVLIVAGLIITAVGMTDVFVKEDLEFMQTDLDCFVDYPTVTPLIAHDRATFGGMLVSCGAVVLLAGLWGFRRGQAWLWWALMLGGNAAYWSTLIVHWGVGYDSIEHLAPAFGGLSLLWIGGALSYSHLAGPAPELAPRWDRWLRDAAPASDPEKRRPREMQAR